MSTDEAVTKDLMETLEDGREGFAKGAERLDKDGNSDMAAVFRQFSQQRAGFYSELQNLAAVYGDSVSEKGSIAGTLHRGWLSLKDALTGSSPSGVLDAAEQGEDHAVKEYEQALGKDITAQLRSTVERQLMEIRSAHDQVRALRNRVS